MPREASGRAACRSEKSAGGKQTVQLLTGRWRERLQRFWRRAQNLLVRLLLLPFFPLFWWGPLTHPYINYRALRQAEREAALGNPAVNRELLGYLRRHRDVFIFAGNSADAIATLHILTGSSVYDYAHNFIPDNAAGNPIFGYALVEEWLKAQQRGKHLYPDEELAVACGWLAHQLADWYAHYAPVDVHGQLLPDPYTPPDEESIFPGYANSHRVLGADFHPEILAQYRLVDHALSEFFHDLLFACYGGDGRFDSSRVEFFRNYRRRAQLSNLLTVTSERFRGVAARILPEEIELLRENLRMTIEGLRLLVHLATFLNPALPEAIYRGVSPTVTGGPDYIGMAVEGVVRGLFCKRYEEIAGLAKLPPTAPWEVYPWPVVVRAVTKPGTLLYRIAHRLGKLLPGEVAHIFQNPEDFSFRFLKLFELRGRMAAQLAATLAAGKLTALTRTEEENALLAFIVALLVTPHPDLATARAHFRRLLQPVVRLGGDPATSEAERLTLMLNAGEIAVRIIPAVARSDPASRQVKALDPATLRFYLDGYDVRSEPELYELHLKRVDGYCLEVQLTLKKGLAEGFHRLLVKIADASGIAAQPLERDFWVGTAVQMLRGSQNAW